MRGGGALETTRQKGRSAGRFHQERYGSFIVGCFVKRRIARDYRRERRCEPGAGGCDWEARYKHRRTAVYGGSSSREGARVMAKLAARNKDNFIEALMAHAGYAPLVAGK